MAKHIFNTAQTPAYMRGAGDPIGDLLIPVIEFDHHQVHEGESFQVTSPPAALASGASIDFRLVVGAVLPTTRAPHLDIEVDATVETWVYLYEAPTTSANGTQQTVHNRNRGSTNTPSATVWLGPTVSAEGVLLSSWIIGSGNKGGGSSRGSLEWVLKPSTVYLIRMTAKAANNDACMRLQFYEDLGV